VVWKIAAGTAASARAHEIFAHCAARNLHLALVQLPQRWFALKPERPSDAEKVTCLRSVLMKPEHHAWLGRIWEVLDEACNV
jgi:tyrosine decarboxylase / aspartate 1-decarboxylase